MSHPRGMLDLVTAHAYSEVLVGRAADLAALREALRRSRGAEPSTVLVGGEAGVGKTRLVEDFCRSLAGEPIRVLTGQCLELGEEGLPLAPFAGALRQLVRAEGTAILAGREHEFARLLPELGAAPQLSDANWGGLFDTVGGLLGQLSAERPLILVVEDLHWADRSTRDLIDFLVRSARLQRLLLIATYRTDELHRGHPLRPFVAELDRVRGVRRVELARLDRDGTAEMLAHLLGSEPEPSTVDAVNERAQGNPFFIEQFAASGDPACSDIPTSLRDLLLSRVDRLPEPVQRVLRVAAVGGTQFGHELLARVAGLDESILDSALRAIAAAQLITFDPDGGYEFRHALVREAVHDDLLPGEHSRLHARYAEAVEAEPHLVALGRAPAEIAHHWHAAHNHPRALATAKHAADEAGRQFAFAEQARLLDRVIELWEQVPLAAELLGLGHLDLLEQAAVVAIGSGEHMQALTLTRAALEELDAEQEPLRAARLLVRRAKLLRNAGKGDGENEAGEAFRLLNLLPTSADQVRLLADIANVFATGDNDRATSIARLAMTGAAELGDVSMLVFTEITFGQVCAGRLTPEDALPTMQGAADRARVVGNQLDLARALVMVSDSLFELGLYQQSATTAAECFTGVNRVGISRSTAVLLLANQAEAELALGRWDEADKLVAKAARLDPPGLLALPWLQLRAKLRLARGHDGADALLGRAMSFLGKPFLDPVNRLCLLELRVLAAFQAGDRVAAATIVRAAVTDPVLAERSRYAWPLLLAGAQVAAANDDTELRACIAAAAAPITRRYPAEFAAAAQVAALLDGTESNWRVAVQAWRADGHPYELAQCLLGLAESQAADRAGAAQTLDELVTIATELGARPLLEAADQLARRLGVRVGAVVVGGSEVLTSREREVLRLVAEGQSNSRIAARLFISPKTASVHVSRIIAKLEVTNRGEAAAVAHRLGLLTDAAPRPQAEPRTASSA